MKGLLLKLGLIGLSALALSGCERSTGISTEFGNYSCARTLPADYKVENEFQYAKGELRGTRGSDVEWRGMTLHQAGFLLEKCKQIWDKKDAEAKK